MGQNLSEANEVSRMDSNTNNIQNQSPVHIQIQIHCVKYLSSNMNMNIIFVDY